MVIRKSRLPPAYISKRREKGRRQMAEPFLDDNLLDGPPPSCALEDFRTPRLRKCPFDFDSMSFTERINPRHDHRTGTGFDGGLDGYNWKVRFEKGGPAFALKLLWDAEAPNPPHYFAAQRECQNAALLQLIEAAVAKRSPGPVLVNPRPKTQQEAEANLFAFSDEVRGQNESAGCSDLLPVAEVPRMRRCYGWTQFTGEEMYRRMPRKVRPPYIEVGKVKRSIREDVLYTAIVYEFVEEGENSPDAVQPVLDFFWRAGFSHCMTPKANNWKSGVLVDFSDIVHPNGYGWEESLFGYRTTDLIIRW